MSKILFSAKFVKAFVFGYSITVGEVYEEYKDEDGFLYMFYSGENTFGISDLTVN